MSIMNDRFHVIISGAAESGPETNVATVQEIFSNSW